MNKALWLAEFARAAAQAQGAIKRVKELARAKGISADDFAIKVVSRAEEYVKREEEFGRTAAAQLDERSLTDGDRRRLYREMEAVFERVRRVALYAQSQVFRLNRIDSPGAPPNRDPSLNTGGH